MVTNDQESEGANVPTYHQANNRVMIHGFDHRSPPNPTGWYPGILNDDSQLDLAESNVEVTDQLRSCPKGPSPTAVGYDQEWDVVWPGGVKPWEEEGFTELGIEPSRGNNPPNVEGNVWKDPESGSEFFDMLKALMVDRRVYFESVCEEDKQKLRLPPNYKSIVEDLYNVCQDNEKLKAMCTYYFLNASSERGLTTEMEREIEKQPWGRIGKDAWETYNIYISEVESQPLVKESLLVSLQAERKIHLARCTIPADVMDALFPGAQNQVFVRDARYGQRRPSARVGSPPPGIVIPDSRGQSPHKNTSPRQTSPQDNPTLEPTPQKLPVQRPGKGPYKTPNVANLRRAQTPPPDPPGKRPRTEDPPGRRPGSAGSGPGSATQPEGQPNATNQQDQRQRVQVGPKKAHQPRAPPIALNIMGTNNMLVPQGNLSSYDKVTYDVVRNYLGDNHPLSHYGELQAQLDHMMEVFRRFQTSRSGLLEAFHVTMDHCESDDDTPAGCGPNCGRGRNIPKCLKKMHAEMKYFLGLQDWIEYRKEFATLSTFLLCFTRAITIIVNDYSLRNNHPQPAFYPVYIESGLLKWVNTHPQPIQGEVSHLARAYGIRHNQVEEKLTMLRAREIRNNNQLDQMANAQIVGSQHELERTPPQIFGGPRAQFKLPEIFRSHFRRWMADNRHKLAPENRYPDDATLGKLIDDLKNHHSAMSESFNLLTKDLIFDYMQSFQERNLKSFPLLEANANPTQPAPEIIVLSSDSE